MTIDNFTTLMGHGLYNKHFFNLGITDSFLCSVHGGGNNLAHPTTMRPITGQSTWESQSSAEPKVAEILGGPHAI